jgi:regulator of sigma E protease
MIDILLAAFWFLIATFILVVGHEWGHFWVARKLGVRTLRFSVGFGSKPLWQRTGADGTQYWLSPIPLGGYVKFVDAADPAVEQGAKPFLSEAVWKRILIVLAGPLVNLILAVAFFWGMYMVGVRDLLPIVGPPERAAATAGLRSGDQIVKVGEQAVGTWTEAMIAMVDRSFGHENLNLTVMRDGSTRVLELSLGGIPVDRDEGKLLEYLGLNTILNEPLVGVVQDGRPAAAAGVRTGDRITHINGVATYTDHGFFDELQRVAPVTGGNIELSVLRGSETLNLPLAALSEMDASTGKSVWRIGIEWRRDYAQYASTYQYTASSALTASFNFIGQIGYNSVHMLYRMLTLEASTKNLAGPVTIARAAKTAAEQGLPYFLRILGLVSLSLFILNLLPVPMLDGGQLLYYLIEVIKGRPLSESAQIAGQYVGLVAIFGLAAIALYNDLVRLFFASP